ncbi:MAG: FKBP-type peptidyl-prolyl cis-trans isomerase [Planctomycetota bacterium]|jgi:FKBP-type peptidyl-prolyl cis-trans isomerase
MAKKGDKKSRGSKGQNRAQSEEFLKKNRTRQGVEETRSGLQFQVLHEGDGPRPTEFDTVSVNQRVSLLNDKVIQDTYKNCAQETFRLEECIDGYREGLLMMGVGSRYKLFVPPELGWGKKGTTGSIGPNAVVIFDVVLEEIEST